MFVTALLLLAPILTSVAAASSPQESRPQKSRPTSRPVVKVFDQMHAPWSAILKRHVHGNDFDYKALAADRAGFDHYLRSLEQVSPAEMGVWNDDQKMAFWINAYNAYTVERVLTGYPIESIREVGNAQASVWDQVFIRLDRHHPSGKRKRLSLNDIEHKILRPTFKDPRIHAAVNCASRSCPPLLNEAFVAEELDKQLDGQVRAWLADETRNRFDRASSTLHVSQIFDWFRADFESDDFEGDGGVAKWIARYAPESEAAWIAKAKDVRYLEYDWSLNDRPSPAGD